MALVSATLASGLEALTATDNVATAIDRIAAAFVDYMAGASLLGVPAVSGVLSGAPRSAMVGAMAALNSVNGAALAVSSGISAFWSAMIGTEVSIWLIPPPAVVIPGTLIIPPGLAGLQSAIQGAFDANVAAGATLSASATTLATAIHATQLGATVQVQTPPAAPVVTPIL